MKNKRLKQNVKQFDEDVKDGGSYLYSKEDRLSTKCANRILCKAFQEVFDVHGKTVLDVGCGDGTYALEIAENGAEDVLGVDPSEEAINAARIRLEQMGIDKKINFKIGNIYDLPFDQYFDCVHLRGVLHHLPDPEEGISRALSSGKKLVILEPNGLNPILKIIEKFSPYHIAHEEQSFSINTFRKWINKAGGKIVYFRCFNLVPFFAPDWLVKFCLVVAPFVEAIPGIRMLACGQYIIVAEKNQT